MDIHIHLGHCHGRTVDFLTIDGNFLAVLLFRSLDQQGTRSAGRIIHTLTGLDIHNASHYFGDSCRGIEGTSLLTCHASELANHILISVTNNIGRDLTGLHLDIRGTKAQRLKVLQ